MPILNFNCELEAGSNARFLILGNGLVVSSFMFEGVTEHYASVSLTREQSLQLAEAIYATCGEPETDPAPAQQLTYADLSPLAKRIYQHMKRAGSISAREASNDYGITSASLARRICDIELAGFTVKRERRVHPISGTRYTRYSVAS